MECNMQRYCAEIEQALERYLPVNQTQYAVLIEAMRYSLLGGGKRIRPILLLEFYRLCGGKQEAAMPFACAVESIHAYSLIHDDLPCMDDDDMRRGKPSCHKQFGQAMALLAGDALQTLAFSLMLREETVCTIGADRAAKAAGVLANAAGAHGMVAGQVIDLLASGKQTTLEQLQQMHRCKTGALISAACQMGCILAGGTPEQIAAAVAYADALGLAFQIVDDVLDVAGETAALGKQTGSDAANDKSTYVSMLGMQQAQQAVQTLTEQAIDALSVFGQEADDLRALAAYLAKRTH